MRPETPHRPHVLLMVETSIVYGRRILRGIAQYQRTHRPWSVFVEQHELGAPPPDWLRNWKGDGVICRVANRASAALLRKNRISAVDVNDLDDDLGLPHVRSDHVAIGRLAAGHLRERGFRHFGFCGFEGFRWSALRLQGLREGLEGLSVDVAVYESAADGPGARPWEREQAAIVRWLLSLPRPVGVFACNDLRGQHVIDAAQRGGLAVPEEVAVVGVDDDTLLCELCDPPLSSVVPDPERIGYEAAALLDRLMAGEPAPQGRLLIEPLGVTTRQSTDILALDDPTVAAALHYIREHACRGLTVNDVLRHVPVSRTTLERRFRATLQRSPQAEIHAVQLRRVRELLAETDLTLDEIAELAGFTQASYLSFAFKRDTGETPSAYRSRTQAGVSDDRFAYPRTGPRG